MVSYLLLQIGYVINYRHTQTLNP